MCDDSRVGKNNDGKHQPETSTKTSKLCYGITISSIVHYINLATGPSTLGGQVAVNCQKTPGSGFPNLV